MRVKQLWKLQCPTNVSCYDSALLFLESLFHFMYPMYPPPHTLPPQAGQKKGTYELTKRKEVTGLAPLTQFCVKAMGEASSLQGGEPRPRHPVWRVSQTERSIHCCLTFIMRVSRQAEGKSAEERVSV